jgi:hypothetical protein
MEKPLRSTGPVAVVAVIVLLVGPLLYVLSVGPAVWLYDRGTLGDGGRQAIEVIYLPLEWAASKTGAIAVPVDWYLDLWRTPPEPVPPPAASPPSYASPPAATTSKLPSQ